MSTLRQQIQIHPNPNGAKNIFRKQKSIDLNDKPTNDSKKILRKQLSVDHVTLGLKHVNPPAVPLNFDNLLWRSSTQSLNDSNLKIVSTSALKKRSQFAASNINARNPNKQELDCSMKSVGEGTAKTRVNINIFLSQDVPDDGYSDNDGSGHVDSGHGNVFKQSGSSTSNGNSSKTASNSENSSTGSGRISVNARRAQFQASRRIMSAPIRPISLDDSKNKRKTRKKKVIRVNLTLNRDKDELDDSPDELPDSPEPRKPACQPLPAKAPAKAKALTTRSRSVLGCDQVGIETLVSMLSSGGSDSEKDEPQQVQQQAPKPETPKPRNILRKTVSFQDDDSFLQSSLNKDPFINRRNTIVPFAGRMRNTRSLFGQEISNLYLPNTDSSNVEEKSEMKNENDINSSNKAQEDVDSANVKAKKTGGEISDDKKTQDNQTPKEQECWRLYEKMKKTGLNVSYDTILRGILKPSELRLLEKQKKFLADIEEKPIEATETQQEPQTVN